MKRKPTDEEYTLLTNLLRHTDRLANELANGLGTETQVYNYNYCYSKLDSFKRGVDFNYYNDKESHLQALYNFIIGPARVIYREDYYYRTGKRL